MINLLLVYDRVSGRRLVEKEYADSRAALQARLVAERNPRWAGRLNRYEIVVLNAASREDMRRTHARYWM